MKFIYLLLALLFVSCAEPPTTELITVEQLEKSALSYSGSPNYIQGTQLLQLAREEITNQDGKFALFRNYDKAVVMLENAQACFENAKSNDTVVLQNTRLGYNPYYVKLDEAQFERLIKTLEKGNNIGTR